MKNTLGKNVLLNGAYQLLNVLFPLLSGAYVARILGPEGVGQVAGARNLVSWFTMAASLGIPAYGVREMARTRNGEERNRLFSELMVLQFLSTGVCLGAYCLWLRHSPSLLGTVFALELVFHFFSMDWLYQGREEYGYMALRSLAVKLISLAALPVFVRSPRDVPVYGVILCLGTGAAALSNGLHAGKFVWLTLGKLHLRRHWRPLLTLMLSSAAASLYCRLDITMLDLLGTDAQVGFYTNAHKVVSLVLTLAASVTAVFLPRLSSLYEHSREVYEQHLSGGLKLVLLLAVPCCTGLMLVAEDVTAVLFGEAFAPASAAIRILACLILIKGVGDLLCYQAILAAGEERHLVAARLGAGLVNGSLNYLLIPAMGHRGAALASVASELLVNGLLLVKSRRLCPVRVEREFLWSLVFCDGIMAAAVLLLRQRIPQGLISLALSTAVGAAVYAAGLLLLRKYMFGGSLCTILCQKRPR